MAGDLEHLLEADPGQPAGVGHHPRVGAEHPGDVGVDLAGRRPRARRPGRPRSCPSPPRPSVVTSRSVETPWKPATTGTWPAARASRSRSPRTSRILARVWSVSVMIPAWLPVNETASTPRSARAMHRSAIEIRSPELTSMSYSRAGWTALTVVGQPDQVVGGLAHGADHDHHVVARTPGPGDVVGHGTDAVGVADRGPAELLDDERHAGVDATGRRAGPGDREACGGRPGARVGFAPVPSDKRARQRAEPRGQAGGPGQGGQAPLARCATAIIVVVVVVVVGGSVYLISRRANSLRRRATTTDEAVDHDAATGQRQAQAPPTPRRSRPAVRPARRHQVNTAEPLERPRRR